jgi:small subunit ribosomal protein S10
MDLSKTEILRIRVKAYDSAILDESCSEIIDVINISSDIKAIGPIFLPTKRRIYCVLRSPHVDKDSREHFEIRIHKRLIDIRSPSEQIVKNLKDLDLSPGVDVEVLQMET